jgi:hypothetical protein
MNDIDTDKTSSSTSSQSILTYLIEACQLYLHSLPPTDISTHISNNDIQQIIQDLLIARDTHNNQWLTLIPREQYQQLFILLKFIIGEITMHLDDQDDRMLCQMFEDRSKFSVVYDTLFASFCIQSNPSIITTVNIRSVL